ncbi:MAG: hypothetical protein U5L45_03890 [Saprospiraceae bacterium]|nr:hypothetical protein [Saprospiraceae bacterium]
MPQTKITGSTGLCKPSDYIFTGANSCNANRSLWTVTQLNPTNGFAINSVTKEVLGQPGSINIKEVYTTRFEFDPTKFYRVSLKVFSECGEGSTESLETKVINNKINYVDAIVCNGYTGEIKMKSTNNCEKCSFQWTPGINFTDSNSENPVLRPQPQFANCGSIFKVTATNIYGCVYTQDVKLNTFDGQIVSVDKDIDKTDVNSGNPIPKSAYCGYEVKINVSMQTCIPPSKIKILITSQADPNFSRIADFDVKNSNGLFVYKAIIPQNLGEDLQNISNKLTATLFFADYGVASANLNVLGNCNVQFPFTLENRFWYFGYWKDNVVASGNYVKHGTITAAIPVRNVNDRPLVYPALYSSTAIGTPPRNENLRIVNSTYTFPNQPNPIQYGYGAFHVNVRIGNRWGMTDIIQTWSKVAVQPTISTHNRFSEIDWKDIWDGTYKGKRVQQGVYLMEVSVSNCRVTNSELYRGYITIP